MIGVHHENQAIGMVECKRTHCRFFWSVSQKNCCSELETYYKENKFTFFCYREFESVVAYLEAFGYSTNIANYLHRKFD